MSLSSRSSKIANRYQVIFRLFGAANDVGWDKGSVALREPFQQRLCFTCEHIYYLTPHTFVLFATLRRYTSVLAARLKDRTGDRLCRSNTEVPDKEPVQSVVACRGITYD